MIEGKRRWKDAGGGKGRATTVNAVLECATEKGEISCKFDAKWCLSSRHCTKAALVAHKLWSTILEVLALMSK